MGTVTRSYSMPASEVDRTGWRCDQEAPPLLEHRVWGHRARDPSSLDTHPCPCPAEEDCGAVVREEGSSACTTLAEEDCACDVRKGDCAVCANLAEGFEPGCVVVVGWTREIVRASRDVADCGLCIETSAFDYRRRERDKLRAGQKNGQYGDCLGYGTCTFPSCRFPNSNTIVGR